MDWWRAFRLLPHLYSAYALAFSFGITLINNGHATASEVINVALAILIGSFSLGMLAPEMQAITRGRAAATKIFETIDLIPTIFGRPIRPKAGKRHWRNYIGRHSFQLSIQINRARSERSLSIILCRKNYCPRWSIWIWKIDYRISRRTILRPFIWHR